MCYTPHWHDHLECIVHTMYGYNCDTAAHGRQAVQPFCNWSKRDMGHRSTWPSVRLHPRERRYEAKKAFTLMCCAKVAHFWRFGYPLSSCGGECWNVKSFSNAVLSFSFLIGLSVQNAESVSRTCLICTSRNANQWWTCLRAFRSCWTHVHQQTQREDSLSYREQR